MNKSRSFVLNLIIATLAFLTIATELSLDAVFAETAASSSEGGAGTRDIGAGTATGTGASGQGHDASELAAGSI
jgi:hypothetical protein